MHFAKLLEKSRSIWANVDRLMFANYCVCLAGSATHQQKDTLLYLLSSSVLTHIQFSHTIPPFSRATSYQENIAERKSCVFLCANTVNVLPTCL